MAKVKSVSFQTEKINAARETQTSQAQDAQQALLDAQSALEKAGELLSLVNDLSQSNLMELDFELERLLVKWDRIRRHIHLAKVAYLEARIENERAKTALTKL